MADMPPPPPGFTLDAPQPVYGAAPKPPPPPTGYVPDNGGPVTPVKPLPGGPADPTRIQPDPGYHLLPDGTEVPNKGGPHDPTNPVNALTPEALDDTTAKLILTGQMDPMGMGGGPVRLQILNNRPVMLKKYGLTDQQLPAIQSQFKADSNAYNQRVLQLHYIQQATDAANQHVHQIAGYLQQLPAQNNARALNALSNFAQRQMSGDTITQLDATIPLLEGEMGRIMTGNPQSGAGGLTDDARHEFDILRSNAAPHAKLLALQALQQMGQGKINGVRSDIDMLNERLTGGLQTYAQLAHANAAAIPSAVPPAPNGTNPPNRPNSPPSGGGIPSQLSAGQQALDQKFLATNPSPQQYAAFLETLIHTPVDEKAAEARLRAAQAGGTYSGDVKQGVGHDLAVGAGGIAQGVGDLLGIVANPITEAYDYVTGSNVRPDLGANLRDALGLPAPQNGEEQLANRISDYGIQGLGFAGAAKAAAAHIPGAIGNVLEALGGSPLTDAASAATGGAAAEGARQMGAGPIVQTIAGVAGGIPTAAIGTKVNALMRGSEELPAVVNAGKQEGVTVNRAMADRSLEPKVVATGKTIAGAKAMRGDMQNVGNQIQGRAQALGNGGTPLEPYNLGETAQNIGKRYIDQSGKDFSRQYAALRTASGGVPIPAQQSLADVDNILARLNKAPDTNAAEINYLQSVRNDLARGLDVESARDIGSKLSGDISKGSVTFGKAEADVLGVRKAISSDIANGLDASGLSGVANHFRSVDAAYSQRMDFIKNTIQKLTGPRNAPLPPEQAAARIQAWAGAKGDSSSLGKIMAQATPEEQADIGSTFADALGKNNKGEFSTAILTNNAEQMPARSKQILFGPDGAKSLNNLQMLAKEHARVTSAMGGSPTGLANDARSWMLNALFGLGGTGIGAAEGGLTGAGIGGVASSAALMGAKIAKDAFSAKSLMSTKITGWLRSAPRSNDPAQINAWFDRLKAIAVREPALAPEVQQIHDAFTNAANSNIAPAAAASGTDGGNQQNNAVDQSTPEPARQE